ncbi:hypothetical protein Bca101_017944 [Brassica carinata]
MAPGGYRGKNKQMKKKKKKKVVYRGMHPDFQLPDDSTVRLFDQQGSFVKPASGSTSTTSVNQEGLLSTPTDKGKSVASDSGSSSDSPPLELPMITSTNRKNGPDLKKLDSLYRPNIMTMHSWSAVDYADYDHYLVQKWGCNGFDKRDNVYVSMRDPNSRVVRLAKRFYRFTLPTLGKVLPSVPKTKPEMSKMFFWTEDDYDSYDLMLINKWNVSGFEGSAETYVNIRGPGSLVFKAFKKYNKS